MQENWQIQSGSPTPYGATQTAEGVNFAVFSKNASAVTLCLFDKEKQLGEIKLDKKKNKTGDVWHIQIQNLPLPLYYSYKVEGPRDSNRSFVFDPKYLLLDPYAKAVNTTNVWGENSNQPYAPKGVIWQEEPFNWEDVPKPKIPLKDLVIYEMHVRGFTHHPSSGVKKPGTFLGVIEKIPYLLELGVNAVELLPLHEFNENEYPHTNPVTHQRLYNYWGYSTVNFYSAMNRYATENNPGSVVNEFKTMVRELHRNGIEVILDVVFNHTAEGNGFTLSFRGLENAIYYIHDPKGHYMNFSGCGNTVSCNHPVVRKMILDCLRYWAQEMGVDGFRFDLASVLTRDPSGAPVGNPPLIEAMTLDPVLADVKLIAEPWDCGGLYQVGTFYPQHGRWAEWNGKYRDNVRRFIKGNPNEKQIFSTRLFGSQDLYGHLRQPYHSINFVTCHDGFSLADLVSYNNKHNEENGENNRDGLNENDSWNCGVEGPSQNKKVAALRERQMRNFLVALMVSMGVPMILMGDEYGHTRRGNNNTWCQDNELNWFLWDQLEKNSGFYRFCKKLIKFRKDHKVLHREGFIKGEDVEWHGLEPLKANWQADDRFVAYTVKDFEKGNDLYIAFNASHLPITLHLPVLPENKKWYCIVSTYLPSPDDIVDEEAAKPVNGTYRLNSYSALILKAK